jgi:RNA polymerase sigma-70 factor, ECF subfamily
LYLNFSKAMSSQTITTSNSKARGQPDKTTHDELMVLVYDELRRLADYYLQSERENHTLQPTALVHEAYLRLSKLEGIPWQNREHLIGMAASMMRRILVDYARNYRRHKRGGGKIKLSLAEVEGFVKDENVDLEVLDEALKSLAENYPQKARVVELRFFGGLTVQETANVLDVSDRTVDRDWKFARVWLLREMSGK